MWQDSMLQLSFRDCQSCSVTLGRTTRSEVGQLLVFVRTDSFHTVPLRWESRWGRRAEASPPSRLRDRGDPHRCKHSSPLVF